MRTIGELFKQARLAKKITISELEEKTKIKADFLSAIENEKWERLPEFPVVMGFVKNISEFIGVDPHTATATLRRDYPPKVLSVNPRPDISKEFVWSPKLTFAVGITAVFLLVSTYLFIQYRKFVNPPQLDIYSPKENQTIDTRQIKVEGKSSVDSVVTVNNQPVPLDGDGKFSVDLNVSENTKEIEITAKSRSGKVTTIKRIIENKIK